MSAVARQLDWSLEPWEAIARWPRSRFLAALCSAPPTERGHRWARWSVLAAPEFVATIGANEPDPIARMFEHVRSTAREVGTGSECGSWGGSPFVGGWMVALSYELGRHVEPRSVVGEVGKRRVAEHWPWSIVMWRCPTAFAFDHAERKWWEVGAERPDLPRVHLRASAGAEPGFVVGEPRALMDRDEYVSAVARAVEYIRAGDVFEVNVARQLQASCSGSARSLFMEVLRGASPWYGAYLELAQDDRMRFVASASPELFLQYHAATRMITTRPIKGTRDGAADPSELRQSPKDRAELNMIVDLMRNDLGRVSRFGTVRVAEAQAIERHATTRTSALNSGASVDEHGGVLHGVATVHGTLRAGEDLADLVRSAFPPGSITGAPKVRAMQLIEELEPRARGLYTGAIGYISDCGNMTLNVAIRTCVVSGRRDPAGPGLDHIADGTLTYGVGAGIVADSDPDAEYAETVDKAGVLLNLVGAAKNQA